MPSSRVLLKILISYELVMNQLWIVMVERDRSMILLCISVTIYAVLLKSQGVS